MYSANTFLSLSLSLCQMMVTVSCLLNTVKVEFVAGWSNWLLDVVIYNTGNVCDRVQRQKSVDGQHSGTERDQTWVRGRRTMYSNKRRWLGWFILSLVITQLHTHTRLIALCPGLPRWAGTRKVKPIWILLKQETVSGSGISWAVCKSAPRSRQITTPSLSFFVGQMPFLPPSQRRQSSEDKVR